ncbi:MAG: hypothetical protein GX224_02125 [Thermoplasmatales archaeon]|nr:hypothetical protein [Thermoplasmatales archaeon]
MVKMATVSFERELVIDTDEAARDFLEAMDLAEKRGPLNLPDLTKSFELGEKMLKGLLNE